MKHNKTILVVDDDADIRELLKIFLEADGFRVSVAADGVEALEQLKNGARPALILLDLMMPRMDGEEFMKQIQRTRFTSVPVVIMSGHTAANKKADELKAVSCLMKPVEIDQLLNTIRRFARNGSTRNAA